MPDSSLLSTANDFPVEFAEITTIEETKSDLVLGPDDKKVAYINPCSDSVEKVPRTRASFIFIKSLLTLRLPVDKGFDD
jgi:hypothetical protein